MDGNGALHGPNRSARLIAVGGEAAGSGKTTLAINLAVALLNAGCRVATIDLDSRHAALTRHIEARKRWMRMTGRDVPLPNHTALLPSLHEDAAEADAADREGLSSTIAFLSDHDVIVIDMPARPSALVQCAEGRADTMLMPVVGSIDEATVPLRSVSGRSDQATKRMLLRNRSMPSILRDGGPERRSMNELAGRLGLSLDMGLSERAVHRDFASLGLTVMDDAVMPGTGERRALSGRAARREVLDLLRRSGLADAYDDDRTLQTGYEPLQPAGPRPSRPKVEQRA